MNRFFVLFAPMTLLLAAIGCDRFNGYHHDPRYDDRYDRRYNDQYRHHDNRYRDDYYRNDRYHNDRYHNDRYHNDRYHNDRHRDPYRDRQILNPQSYTYKLLDLHNEQRSRGHIAPLAIDSRLEKAAQDHAEWMARNNRLTHQGENGSNVQTRAGRGYRFVGENIAMGFYNPEEVMRGWLDSHGHRRNIIDNRYSNVGFGAAEARDGTIYWCAVFGS